MFSLTPVSSYGNTYPDQFASDSSTLTIHKAAEAYISYGWSLIPVHGNGRPNAPKAPALKQWTTYQQRQPTPAEVYDWFVRKQFQGIGIVCGTVSQLAVLDIDDAGVAESFKQSLPALADTLTVRSGGRGLPHYYYHVPPGLDVPNKRIPGAELRYTGHYVVAPPTNIPSGQYQVVFDCPPRALSEADLRCLLEFFDSTLREVCQNDARPPMQTFVGHTVDGTRVESRSLVPDAALHYYRSQAGLNGRNIALFRTAILARDCGWSPASAKRVLGSVHAKQPALASQPLETPQQRLREAERTIESAFSRPPRRATSGLHKVSTGLPNSVREKLLQQGGEGIAAARLLDALLGQVGWEPGSVFSEYEAWQAVQPYCIGRRSVRSALKVGVQETYLFAKGSPPNPLSQTANAAAHQVTPMHFNKCFVGKESNRVKTGRPASYYILPHPAALCNLLGVRPQASDALQPADLKSPTAYRQAQYRELIQRRPGQYTRAWLSQRLGISVKTLRRYDRPAGVRTQPLYEERLLTWQTATMLPDDIDATVAHAFLEFEGRKFPALKRIALGLLARKRPVIYKLRLPNFYYPADSPLTAIKFAPQLGISSAEPVSGNSLVGRESSLTSLRESAAQEADSEGNPNPTTRQSTAIAAADPPAAAARGTALSRLLSPYGLADDERPTPRSLYSGPGSWHPVNHRHLGALFAPAYHELAASYESEVPIPPPKRKPPGKPLPDAWAESLALHLYDSLRAHSPGKSLTLTGARRLVSQYRSDSIQTVLHKMAYRTDIANPAGFFVKVLKAEGRLISQPEQV